MRKSKFHVYKDGEGRWRWYLLARNGRLIAESGYSYSRKHDAKRAVMEVVSSVLDAGGRESG